MGRLPLNTCSANLIVMISTKPSKLLIALLATLAVGRWNAAAQTNAPEKMNVVFILADDLGWADTTLYGHTTLYRTPNLERLAKRGMVFTRAYAASPLCSPTRSSILTGQTPARTGFTAPNGHLPNAILHATVEQHGPAGNKALQTVSITRLDTNYPTLGKQFHQAGYATGHFGKWHLGPEPYSPLQHGFDVDIPHWAGPGPAGTYVAPWKFKDFDADPGEPHQHIEDRMAKEAVKWMNSLPKNKPFFMNYWMFSVHAPFNAKAGLIDKYRRQIDLKNPQHSPTYAAMVESMDDAVGTLMDAVDAAGLTDRTIFIFTSDNGGNMYNGIREKDRNGNEFVAQPTSNKPLRGGKATVYEGGIREPAIIVWPKVTKPGTRTDEVIQSTDFYPTLLTELGIGMPANYPVDGVDIRPALEGGKLAPRAIFTYFPHSPPVLDWLPPSASVITGDWKLIRLFYQGENGAHDYRLYNVKDDIGETNNLAKSQPERVKQMDQLIENYLVAAKAVTPRPNPAFNPAFYHPENIGVQPGGLKVGGEQPKKPRAKKPAEAEQVEPYSL